MEIPRSRSPDLADDLVRDFSAELDTGMFNARLKQVVVATHVHSSPAVYAEYEKIHKKLPQLPLLHGPLCQDDPKGLSPSQEVKATQTWGPGGDTACESFVLNGEERFLPWVGFEVGNKLFQVCRVGRE